MKGAKKTAKTSTAGKDGFASGKIASIAPLQNDLFIINPTTQFVDVELVARIACLTVRRYRQLAKEEVVPVPKRKRVPLVPALHLLFKYKNKIITGSGNLSLTDERMRLTKNQADKAEFEMKILRNEYVKAEDVKTSAFARARKTRDAILNVATRVSSILASENSEHKCHAMLTQELNQALEELSNV